MLNQEIDMFNQFKDSVGPPPKKGTHVDGKFITQRPQTDIENNMSALGYRWNQIKHAYVNKSNEVFEEVEFGNFVAHIPPRKKNYTLGGIGRRRLVGASSDTAWDFLTTTFFQQPGGGVSGRQVGIFGGMRGLKLTGQVFKDAHDNLELNNWKRAIYQWMRDTGESGNWTQKQMRAKWIQFKQYVEAGHAAVHGESPKGYSQILQAYMLMAAQGKFRSKFIRDKSPNVTNITRDEADSLGVTSDVSSDHILLPSLVEPEPKRHKPEHTTTSEGDGEMESFYSGDDSSHTKSNIADRLRARGDKKSYKERGSEGFHTVDLEFANTAERLEWEKEHAGVEGLSSSGSPWSHIVELSAYDPKDAGSWLGPVFKTGAPIVRINTNAAHTKGYQFNGNAVRAESMDLWRDGSNKLARTSNLVFGDGSLEELEAGWSNIFLGLDCAYQRCWQESQLLKETAWTQLGRIPNTVHHSQHVFAEEYRTAHVLPMMHDRWGDKLLNLSFEDSAEFYNMCVTEEFQFMGTKYKNLLELFKAELKVGERKENDMYKYFGRGLRSDVQNIGDYVIHGFSVLSPIDILCLQDMLGETNWLAYFSKFNEMSQIDGEDPPVHWMQPWLFCLTHMVAEGVIPESNHGTLMRMQTQETML